MASISSVPNILLSGHTVPSNLASLLPQSKTPWQVSRFLFERMQKQDNDPVSRSSKPYMAAVVTPSDPEYRFVMSYFFSTKPSGYSIKSIQYIYNPTQIGAFEMGLPTIELGAKSFPPSWSSESLPDLRGQMIQRWENQTAQFSPTHHKSEVYPSVKILPLWHGTTHIESICTGGFTYFGKHDLLRPSPAKAGISKSTDAGFFGSGIYFTNSAAYASMYGSSKILLAWVAMRQPFPVVSDCPVPNEGFDMRRLQGLGAYSTYNAHYIPVTSINPSDPGNMVYHPCYRTEVPSWDELVVFQPSQTLAQFVVELAVDLPISPSSSASFTREQAIDLIERAKGGDKKVLDDLKGYVSLNNPIAQNSLGWLCKRGEIVAQDFAEALRLFRLAADQGYAPAQYNLGMAYKNGEGVMRDFIEAVKWFRLASNQEFPGSQTEINQLLSLFSHPIKLDERKDSLSSSSTSSSGVTTSSSHTLSLTDLQREFPNFRIFDERVWEHYLGIRIDPRELPPLTTMEIVEIRNHLLTIYPKVKDNAGVTLLTIPAGLTLSKLDQLVKAPKRGHRISNPPLGRFKMDVFHCSSDLTKSEAYYPCTISPVRKSHRILITNSVIKDSINEFADREACQDPFKNNILLNESGYSKNGQERICNMKKKLLNDMGCELPKVMHIAALFYLTRICHITETASFSDLGLYNGDDIRRILCAERDKEVLSPKDATRRIIELSSRSDISYVGARNVLCAIEFRPDIVIKSYAWASSGSFSNNDERFVCVGAIKRLGSDREECVIS